MSRSHVASPFLLALLLVSPFTGCGDDQADLTPITTSSEVARDFYLQALDEEDRLRLDHARQLYEKALAEDPGFALAHLGLANTASTSEDYYNSLQRAAQLAEQASEAERWIIDGQMFAANGNPVAQRELYHRLAGAYPRDPRVHYLLGSTYLGTGKDERVIEHCTRAIQIDPDYSPPYNHLGYAHLALGQYGQAEDAFRKYIELIPDQANPYDSLAELMLKMGRYDEAIASYRSASEKDPTWYWSQIGIGYSQILATRLSEARATFRALLDKSDDYVQDRQALSGLAAADLVAGDLESALGHLNQRLFLARGRQDGMDMYGDFITLGEVHLAAGDIDQAAASFDEALAAAESADVADGVKGGARRNHVYRQALIAISRGDLDRGRELALDYRREVSELEDPFEIQRQFELSGLIALADGDPETALKRLGLADQTDPHVLLMQANALRGAGQVDAARQMAESIVTFNEPRMDFAPHWRAARDLLDELSG